MALRDLVRKYPDRIERFISGIGTFFSRIDEPEAKAALLWMIAEYGHLIPESPYLIEPLIDSFAEEQSQAHRPLLVVVAASQYGERPFSFVIL